MQSRPEQFDVIVVGGGMGGVGAAISAAQAGARTLVVEMSGQFGGVGTNCLISHFSQRPLPGKHAPTFIETLLKELEDRNAVRGIDFNPEVMTILLDELVMNAGAIPLFYTALIGVACDGRHVQGLQLFNKSGQFHVEAPVFIDATGDGDLCAMAGAEYERGDGTTEFGQPMTLAFFVSGIDTTRLPDRDEINRLYDHAKAEGRINNPRENVLMFEAVENGTLQFNTTRILHRDGINGWSLSQATVEGRQQVKQMFQFLKTLPGFEQAYLSRIASRIGVRETRRFKCDYRLTVDDMRARRRFADGIMATRAHLDIHNPHGSGTRYEPWTEDIAYEVPLRCLIPQDLDNVLIGCRAIGASHEAFSAVRMMPHVAEYGRAAGLTAAWSIKHHRPIRDVDVGWVRETLGTLA